MASCTGAWSRIPLLAAALFIFPAISTFAAETVKIGVLALRGPERCLAQWSPTADYLSQTIPGKTFKIVPIDFDTIVPAIEKKDIDFILTNSAIYVESETKFGVNRITTLKNRIFNQTVTTFGGVIFCLSTRQDIRTLKNLRKKRFMAVETNSFGGWIAAWRELKEAGIDPDSDFSSLTFGGTHDRVVDAVLKGEVDAGTVRTGVLENMAAEGKIQLDDFYIFHTHGGEQTNMPFLNSTREYPEWPMAKLPHTPDTLAEAVAVALIGMKADSPAALAASCSGWTVPHTYASVHECLRFLQISPYENFGKITLREVIQKYWLSMLLVMTLFVVMALSIAGFFRLNRNLRVQQEDLRKSEEKNRLLITHAISGIAIHEIVRDASGMPVDYVYLDANPAFEVQTGLRVSAVLGRRVTEVFPEAGTAPFIDIYGNVVITGDPVTFEHYFAPLGRHFQITAYRIHDNRFATTFTDVTEQKQAEEDIKRNETRLKTLVEILKHPSESIQEFLDFALEQAIALTGSKIGYIYHYHEDRKEFVLNSWSRSVMAECAIINPQTCYQLDKTGIWGEAVRQRRPIIANNFQAAHPLKKGYPEGHVSLSRFMTFPITAGDEIVGVIGLANKASDYDDTDLLQISLLMKSVWAVLEQKRMAASIREAEIRLRGITDSSPDAILMMDPQGEVSFWNPAAETILGYRREEVIGRNLHGLFAPGHYLEKHQAAYPKFLKDGCGNAIGKTIELAARRKDGQEIAIALSLSGVALADGWHAVGILRDITAQKKVLEDISQTNQELEAAIARANEMTVQAEIANIAKSEFLANMSHEIRTPMNGVIGMTGLLLDTSLTDEQRRFAEIVRASGESLLSLINDILDFSKIEAKKLDLEILDFDLQSLLDDFTASLAFQAQEKGLELLCSLDPAAPALLRGDPGRLRQILTNLTGNAIKFTREGEVAIRVTLVSETDADVLLRFSVRDTGIGIPENKIGHLFEKFSQVDASTTRQFGGTGLGLAISKELAGLMGGSIGVLSREGDGSEFWFTARLKKQPENAQREAAAPVDLTGLRVLIVDDNNTNREILAAQTAAWGIRPTLAESGASGLEALQKALSEKDPFRVAIVDMQMPEMDGETFGHTVQADERLKNIPLILLTSLGMRGDSHRYADIGFSAYLTKPARARELKSILALVLSKQEGQTPAPILTRHSTREIPIFFGNRKSRILLAEDNVTNQQVALGILKKYGVSADAVANGSEAVKALESIPYDLVLMDVQMPEMDGFEATRKIRDPASKVLNHTIPIIAMTAHAMSGDREKCLNAGMNGYIAKPVSPTALAEALEKWFPRGEAAPEAAPEKQCAVPPLDMNPTIWNKAVLLDRLMDDEDLMETIVQSFLEDIPVQIATLRDLLAKNDVQGVGRLAHRIKGASANAAGDALQEAAAKMEAAAHPDAPHITAAMLTEVETAFQRLNREMLAFINRNTVIKF